MRARPDGPCAVGRASVRPAVTRRRRPSAWGAAARALGCLLACALLPACESTPAGDPLADPEEPLTLGAIETTTRSSLVAEPGADDGLARVVRVDLSLAPRDAVPLQVIATPPEGSGVLPAFVEVELAWQDYLGVQPTSWGRTVPSHLPFGPDGEARRGDPIVRSLTIELEDPSPSVLARVLEARPTLRPVDLRVGSVHTGGQPVRFPAARVATLRRAPSAPLATLLGAPDVAPAEVFLAAAHEGEQQRTVTLYALLDSLAEAPRPVREAIFGALLYLTGTTNGRSEAQWRAWVARNVGPAPEPTTPADEPVRDDAPVSEHPEPEDHP